MHELLPDDLEQQAHAKMNSTKLAHELRTEFTVDPLTVAAHGAAEFAKRTVEAPKYCRESEYCRERRRKLQGGGDGLMSHFDDGEL